MLKKLGAFLAVLLLAAISAHAAGWHRSAGVGNIANTRPRVTLLVPTGGSTAGGDTISIQGVRFDPSVYAVTFGTVPAASFSYVSPTVISAVTPAGAAGTVDVTVATKRGVSHTNQLDKFTYTAATAPIVSLVSPNQGYTTGGDSTTISGTGFIGATNVNFCPTGGGGCTAAASFSIVTATSINVVTPAASAGDYDIKVTNVSGQSSANPPKDVFTFVTPITRPTVLNVTPNSGTTAGGTSTTVGGLSFTGASAVQFCPTGGGGCTSATSFSGVTDTSMTVVAPAASAGTYDIIVTNSAGPSSANSPSDVFTFVTPVSKPIVLSVTPNSGTTAGATSTSLTGLSFTGTTNVDFCPTIGGGCTPAASFSSVTSTTMTVVTPAAAAGDYDIKVTNAAGQSTANAPKDVFTFVTPLSKPTVLSVTPNSGTAAGGDSITVTGLSFTGTTAVNFCVVVVGGCTPAASFSGVTSTSMTVVTPVAPAGMYNVRVTNPAGQSNSSRPADQFTFVTIANRPIVLNVTPDDGATAGGAIGTITGSRFTGAICPGAVKFGTNTATACTVNSDSSITFTAPALGGATPFACTQNIGFANCVDVRVTVGGVQSAITPDDQFAYDDYSVAYQASGLVTNFDPGGSEFRQLIPHREAVGTLLPSGGGTCTTISPNYDPIYNACASLYGGNAYAVNAQCPRNGLPYAQPAQVLGLNNSTDTFSLEANLDGNCVDNGNILLFSGNDFLVSNAPGAVGPLPLDLAVFSGVSQNVFTRDDATGFWSVNIMQCPVGAPGSHRSQGLFTDLSLPNPTDILLEGDDQCGVLDSTWSGFTPGVGLFTASIAGTTMTVTGSPGVIITNGTLVTDAGGNVAPNTYVLLGPNQGNGAYTVSVSQTVASETMSTGRQNGGWSPTVNLEGWGSASNSGCVATGIFNQTGSRNFNAGDQLTIGNSTLNIVTALGTAPGNVLRGATFAATASNIADAIDGKLTDAGTKYITLATTPNSFGIDSAPNPSGGIITFNAIAAGPAGGAYPTTYAPNGTAAGSFAGAFTTLQFGAPRTWYCSGNPQDWNTKGQTKTGFVHNTLLPPTVTYDSGSNTSTITINWCGGANCPQQDGSVIGASAQAGYNPTGTVAVTSFNVNGGSGAAFANVSSAPITASSPTSITYVVTGHVICGGGGCLPNGMQVYPALNGIFPACNPVGPNCGGPGFFRVMAFANCPSNGVSTEFMVTQGEVYKRINGANPYWVPWAQMPFPYALAVSASGFRGLTCVTPTIGGYPGYMMLASGEGLGCIFAISPDTPGTVTCEQNTHSLQWMTNYGINAYNDMSIVNNLIWFGEGHSDAAATLTSTPHPYLQIPCTPGVGQCPASGLLPSTIDLVSGIWARNANAVNATGIFNKIVGVANFTAGDTITVGNTTLNIVTPIGSTPGNVLRSSTWALTAANIAAAINGTAGSGTNYIAPSPTPNTTATVGTQVITFTAIAAGPAGNAYPTTTTSAAAAFNDTTMGGGPYTLYPPDGAAYTSYSQVLAPRIPPPPPQPPNANGQPWLVASGCTAPSCPFMTSTRATATSPFPNDACQVLFWAGTDAIGGGLITGFPVQVTNMSWALRAPLSEFSALNMGSSGQCVITPTITSISPGGGGVAGGTQGTITGTNFCTLGCTTNPITSLTFGGTPATSFTINSDTSISFTAPAGTGAVNVVASNATGGVGTAVNAFTYADFQQSYTACSSSGGTGVVPSLDCTSQVDINGVMLGGTEMRNMTFHPIANQQPMPGGALEGVCSAALWSWSASQQACIVAFAGNGFWGDTDCWSANLQPQVLALADARAAVPAVGAWVQDTLLPVGNGGSTGPAGCNRASGGSSQETWTNAIEDLPFTYNTAGNVINRHVLVAAGSSQVAFASRRDDTGAWTTYTSTDNGAMRSIGEVDDTSVNPPQSYLLLGGTGGNILDYTYTGYASGFVGMTVEPWPISAACPAGLGGPDPCTNRPADWSGQVIPAASYTITTSGATVTITWASGGTDSPLTTGQITVSGFATGGGSGGSNGNGTFSVTGTAAAISYTAGGSITCGSACTATIKSSVSSPLQQASGCVYSGCNNGGAGRVMAQVNCAGSYFASVGAQVYQRVPAGPGSHWQLWASMPIPDAAQTGTGAGFRGLSCVPWAPFSSGYALLATTEGSKASNVWRMDPGTQSAVPIAEGGLRAVTQAAWGGGGGYGAEGSGSGPGNGTNTGSITPYPNASSPSLWIFGENDSNALGVNPPIASDHPSWNNVAEASSGFFARTVASNVASFALYPQGLTFAASPLAEQYAAMASKIPWGASPAQGIANNLPPYCTSTAPALCAVMSSTRTLVVSQFPQDACQYLFYGGFDDAGGNHDGAWIMRAPVSLFTPLNAASTGTCPNAPTITNFVPTLGSIQGGTLGTITGSGFTTVSCPSGVTFGTTPVTSCTVNSDSSISFTAPPGTDGTSVFPAVTNAAGQTGVSPSSFTYQGSISVAALDVTNGPAAGGTTVNVTGSWFDNASSVCFGVSCVTPSGVVGGVASTLMATSPAGSSGATVDVTVVTPVGTSPTGSQDQFTYGTAAPVITSLTPNNGLLAGSTSVTIAGQFFTGINQLLWGIGTLPVCGSSPCYTFVNDTTLTVSTPSRAVPRSLYVVVTTPSGSNSPNGPNNQYTYNAPQPAPVVTSISPISGPAAGGTTVTINGSGFFNGGGSSAVSEIDFTPVGTTAVVPCDSVSTFCGTSVSCTTDILCTVHSPAGTGTQDIQVTTPSGSSAANPADQYTFNASAGVPTVTAVNPNSGGIAGGANCLVRTPTSCTVVITGTGFKASGGVTGAAGVKFGSTNATSYVVNTDNTITAVFPAGSAGATVDVKVANGAGTSSVVAADQFTFQDWVLSYQACTDVTCAKDNQNKFLGGTELRLLTTNGTPPAGTGADLGGVNGGIIPGTTPTQCGGGPCYCTTARWDYSQTTGKCEAVLAGTGTWQEQNCSGWGAGAGQQVIANTTGPQGPWNQDVLLDSQCGPLLSSFNVTNMLIDGFFTWDSTGNTANGGLAWNPPLEVAIASGAGPAVQARNWHTGNWTSLTPAGATGTNRGAGVHTDLSVTACGGHPCSYLLVGNQGLGIIRMKFNPTPASWGFTVDGTPEPFTNSSGGASCTSGLNICADKPDDWAGVTMPPTTGPWAKPITVSVSQAFSPPHITVNWTGNWGLAGAAGTIGVSGFTVGSGGSGAANVNGSGMPILSSTQNSATFAATGPVVCGTGCGGTILVDVTGMRQKASTAHDGCPGNDQTLANAFTWCENHRVTGFDNCPDSAGVVHAFMEIQMEVYERVDGATPHWKVMPNHSGVLPSPYANIETASSGLRGLHCIAFGSGYALISTAEGGRVWRFDPSGLVTPVVEISGGVAWASCGICAEGGNMIDVNNSTVYGEGESFGAGPTSNHPIDNQNSGRLNSVSGFIVRKNASNYWVNPPDPPGSGLFSSLLKVELPRVPASKTPSGTCGVGSQPSCDGYSDAAGTAIWQGTCSGSPILCPTQVSSRSIVLSTLPLDGTTHCQYSTLSNGDPGQSRFCDGSVLYFGGFDANAIHGFHDTAWMNAVSLSTVGGVP